MTIKNNAGTPEPAPWPRTRRSTPADHPVICLLGIPVDEISLDNAVRQVVASTQTRETCFISTPNVNFLVASQKDVGFRRSIQNSHLVLADGSPVVWLSRLMGAQLPERVSGADLFESVRFHQPDEKKSKVRVFFFGGPPGAAEQACASMGQGADQCVGVGSDPAGFGSVLDMSPPHSIDKINQCEADFLVVSLGAAKGQQWIMHNLPKLNVPVISHLGAVVNFVSGRVRRAPKWVQKAHLEWLFRIQQEPTLWKRYATDALSLAKLMATQVAPYVVGKSVLNGLHKISGVDTLPGDALWRETRDGAQLVLKGILDRNHLEPLRTALNRHRPQGRIEVNCADLKMVDLYSLGLLVRHFDLNEDDLYEFTQVAPSVSALIRFAGAGYLLRSGSRSAASA